MYVSFTEYQLGKRFLMRRARAMRQSRTDRNTWASLAKGQPARVLLDRMAEDESMPIKQLASAVALAEAVETIRMNCDEDVFGALFRSKYPQKRSAVMQLSRTADTRQRYRIAGVLEQRFRSVAPQGMDPVYDTVAFREVPSRLSRARGTLGQLANALTEVPPEVAKECRRLVRLNLATANQLRMFLKQGKVLNHVVPRKLSKDEVWPVLAYRDVRGKVVGMARQSLRLTIKNIWDYPEMQRRNLFPSPPECARTLQELKQIRMASEMILAMLDKDFVA